MTHVNSRVVAVAAFAAVAMLAACDKKPGTRTALAPDPSAQVIGVAPANPTGDPPGTTPVSANATEVSKPVESNSMPLPGQPNDHSNVAPLPSQNADSQHVLKSTEAASQANNGTKDEGKTQ
jgi:hypothetical protein